MEAWDGMGWVGMAGWEKALSQYLFRLFSISLFDTANTPQTRRFDWTAKHTYVSRLISLWISQIVQGSRPRRPAIQGFLLLSLHFVGRVGWLWWGTGIFHVYMTHSSLSAKLERREEERRGIGLIKVRWERLGGMGVLLYLHMRFVLGFPPLSLCFYLSSLLLSVANLVRLCRDFGCWLSSGGRVMERLFVRLGLSQFR